MSRQELADLVNLELVSSQSRRGVLDATYIGKLERGEHRWPQDAYRTAFRTVLGALNDAALGFFVPRQQQTPDTEPLISADPSGVLRQTMPGASQVSLSHGGTFIQLPGGRALPPVLVQLVPDSSGLRTGLGSVRTFSYLSVAGSLRLREMRSAPDVERGISDAYVLDDFSSAIVWAVCGFDQALLDDDAGLVEAWTAMQDFMQLPQSIGAYEGAAALSQPSQGWLGSQFCATYIQQALPHIAQDAPSYWTREQRGEEAATWLLFRHKYDYLLRTAIGQTSRVFCIPPDLIAASPPTERILLLLAIALMESRQVRCAVISDPAYSGIDGFALSGRRAIRANWVRAPALWSVEVVGNRSTVAEYTDASRYAAVHAINSAPSPVSRLQLAAEYLLLDWPWIQRRSRQLAREGVTSLIRPRSRLLSMAGVLDACQFISSTIDN